VSFSDVNLVPRTVRHDGVTTHYVEARASGAETTGTLVLVHDGWFGADAATLWSGLVGHLGGQFRILAPDMLGFGRTDKVVHFDRSMYAYRAAHLGSFVRAVCPNDEVHAVGTSMGGSILLRDAVADPPEIPVRSIVSISGSGGPWRSAFGADELSRYDGTREDIARVLAHMADDFEGYDDLIDARHANAGLRGHAECLLAGTVKRPGPGPTPPPADPWPEQLARVTVPVTVVAGERDPLLEPGWEQHLEGVCDLLRTVRIDTKHAPSLDHPELVAEVIRETVGRAGELVGAGREER